MCIKDKIWLKRFGLALLGVGLYSLDIGTDNWVGNSLIQNCHVKFGASVLCLVYVVPGLFAMIGTMFDPKRDDDCISVLAIGIFLVPLSILALLLNLIILEDEGIWMNTAKQ